MTINFKIWIVYLCSAAATCRPLQAVSFQLILSHPNDYEMLDKKPHFCKL